MAYHLINYLFVLFPLSVIFYQLTPKKYRYLTLTVFSYIFFLCISKKLIVYLWYSTAAMWLIGLWMEKVQKKNSDILKTVEKKEKRARKKELKKRERWILILGILLQVVVLFALKYLNFAIMNVNFILKAVSLEHVILPVKWAVPVGISFYTMQAVSYLADIYMGKIKADHNPGRLAAYMSFFPSLMEGPICRYSDTAMQIYEGKPVNWNNLTRGIQRMTWGMFQKMIIADRLDIFVKSIFDGYKTTTGLAVLVGAAAYTIQLYADFAGCMDIVIGSGEVFGVGLPENFRQPFFSRNASEFWTRWHISLGTWFKDYIFYPISMSEFAKKLNKKSRKRLGNVYGAIPSAGCALFMVWLCNGIWHGSGWHYIAFGMYYFLLILAENIIEPVARVWAEKIHLNRDSAGWVFWQRFRTFWFVILGELIFRAKSLSAAGIMLKNMTRGFSLQSLVNRDLLQYGLDIHDFRIVILAVLVVFLADLLHEKGIRVRAQAASWKLPVRWTFYYLLLFSVLIFGAYGRGYTAVDLIYAGF